MENTDPGKANLPRTSLITAIICTLLFFIIQFIGILHHEPWMDEYQAFQIAMNSHSLSDLFYNMREEGHPATWHLILFVITRFTQNIFAMQVVHIIIASAGIFILFRYSPFSLIEKILISLGYFMLYEYAQISRVYVLTVFSVICICAVMGQQYYKRKSSGQALKPSLFFSIAALLVLLANSTLYGLVICGSFTIYFLWIVLHEKAQIFSNRNLKTALLYSILIVLLGLIFSCVEIMPPADNGFSSFVNMGFDPSRAGIAITQLILAYLPFPQLGSVQCWCTYFILPDHSKTLVFASLLAFTAIVIILVKKPSLLIFYFIATIGISGLLLELHVISLHYFGHHFIVLFACLWLERYISPNPNILIIIPNSFINILKKVCLYGIMAVQALAGIYMYYIDFNYPFANCDEAGRYVMQNHLDRFPILGGYDFYVLPLSYYTHQAIYTFDRNDTSRFVIWDKKRVVDLLKPSDFFGRVVTQVDKSKNDTALVCLTFELKQLRLSNGATEPLVEGNVDAGHRIKKINEITTTCMIPTNDYYFYLVWKK